MKKFTFLTTLALVMFISPVFSQINLKSVGNKITDTKTKLGKDKSDDNTVSTRIPNGNNRNDGSKQAPFKNLQKAIDQAPDNAVILVAEGNYFGMLNSGNINITKPVKIYGGYSTDFSTRDVLKYLTMVQPSPESNGTQNGQGTMQIQVKTANTEVVIDGLIFDRGNSIAYNSKGEGKPAGVESAMMQPIGGAGLGGPNLT